MDKKKFRFGKKSEEPSEVTPIPEDISEETAENHTDGCFRNCHERLMF